MSKNIVLHDKQDNQVLPITVAENVYVDKYTNIKDYMDEQIGLKQFTSTDVDIKQYIDDKLKKVRVNYSLEEQVIGTWIDGKPLYQKTICENVDCGNTNIPFDFSKILDIVDIRGSFILIQEGNIVGAVAINNYCYNWNGGNSYWFDILNKNLAIASQYYDGKMIITIQYTKTTD